MSDSSLKTKLAFYIWLGVLLASLFTFALGLFLHVLTLMAAPWLSLKTQAIIHGAIPVFLTAVKFVTVPILVLLTPFARHHATFRSWASWSRAKVRKLQRGAKVPWNLAKAVFFRAKATLLRSTSRKRGR
jgi:hypothetical protein